MLDNIQKPKHAGGRPPKYRTVQELQVAIDTYFDNAVELEWTICGLSLSLGFAQRKSLLDYEGYSGEFCNCLKRAIQKIEQIREKTLVSGKNNPAGVIFWLKNHGWADKQEITGAGGLPLQISIVDGYVVKKSNPTDNAHITP